MNHPSPHSEPPRPLPAVRRPPTRIAWIWLVPAVAVLVALGLAIHALRSRGPEITLRFSSAAGLEASKSQVKYKDVPIGTVSAITLSEDRKAVLVKVDMNRDAAPLLVQDSRFWVVSPHIGATGISGLGTMLSGPYIAIDPGRSQRPADRFVGLDIAPQVVNDMPGRQFLLGADDLGSIDVGVPLYFRRIAVGRVVGYGIRPDGKAVDVRVFVDAPYDRFVTPATRFWHASGVDVSLNADGLKMNVQSLASVIAGGIAFADVDEQGQAAAHPAPAGTRFTLYQDRTTALQPPDTVVQRCELSFHESVRGLGVGSPVEFRGLPVGEVSHIGIDYRPGLADPAMLVTIDIYPERFARLDGTSPNVVLTADRTRRTLDDLATHGLRAQMRDGNLLTGQRYVALDLFPRIHPGRIQWKDGVALLPTQAGTLDSLQDTLQNLMDTTQKTLQNSDKLVVDVDGHVVPQLSATLTEANQTLVQTRKVLDSDAPTQQQLRDTLREFERSAASVRDLADFLQRHPDALVTGRRADR